MPQNYSLIVPSWYPVEHAPISGIFVFKHVQLIAEFTPAHVLYAFPASNEQIEKYKLTERNQGQFLETIVYYKESSSKIANQFLQMYSWWKGFCHIKKKHGIPSVIHNHVVFPAGLFALFISILYRIPLLITEHWSGYTDEDGRYNKFAWPLRFLMSTTFKRAKKVSVVSHYLKNSLVTKIKSVASKITITPNVINAHIQVKNRNERKRGINALCIANLNDHEKNISGLLEALSVVVKQNPNFSLTFVGDGSGRKVMEKKANLLGLTPLHVRFVGSVSNDTIQTYYETHDFFILNSHFETFSIATAEAIANGLPVIVTKCGGPEEFVDATNGILVEKRDTIQLTQAIKKMIDTFSDYNPDTISKNIMARYSSDSVRQTMKQLYYFN